MYDETSEFRVFSMVYRLCVVSNSVVYLRVHMMLRRTSQSQSANTWIYEMQEVVIEIPHQAHAHAHPNKSLRCLLKGDYVELFLSNTMSLHLHMSLQYPSHEIGCIIIITITTARPMEVQIWNR